MSASQAWFRVYRNGVEIAGGAGPNEDIESMAAVYVSQYAMDSTVNVRIQKTGKQRKTN